MLRASFYSDGLNLLRGAGKKHGWLDLFELAGSILEEAGSKLEKGVVHHFISEFLYEDREAQKVHLDALAFFYPKAVRIHRGWFQKKQFHCRECGQDRNPYCATCRREWATQEEKTSDVGLGC